MKIKIFSLLRDAGMVVSNSEARRVIFGGAVFLNDNQVGVHGEMISEKLIEVNVGDKLRVGKRTMTLSENHLRNAE